MNRDSFARLTTSAMVAAAGLMVASSAAEAQQSQITVTAPRTMEHQVGRTASGIPIDQLSVSRTVSYADLDLQTAGGLAALDQRIRDTAGAACAELDSRYPMALYPPVQSNRDCESEAIDGAQAQVSLAVATRPVASIAGVPAPVSYTYTPAPQALYTPKPQPQPFYIEHTGPHVGSGDYMAEELNRQELQSIDSGSSGVVMSGSSD